MNGNNSHENSSLKVRDDLARDRTLMANERTLLAYLRTAILLAASSVTLIKLFPGEIHFFITGIVLIPASIAFALFGYIRFRRTNKKIASRN